MPKVFEKDGYKFFFYSNEHRPIHVHVRYGDGEAVLRTSKNVKFFTKISDQRERAKA
jgi:hypothetical protein